MSISLLLALAANPAQAESEILFRTSRPVMIYVDGRQAPLTSNLRMRAADLEPGSHEVTVKGMFGKTLYEGEIELEDWTVAHAEWSRGELEIRKTEKIDRKGARARRGSPWADEEGNEPVLAEGVVIAEAPPAEIPVEEPVEAPAEAAVPAVPEPEGVGESPAELTEVSEPPLAVPVVEAPPVAMAPAEVEVVGAVLTGKPTAPATTRIFAREGMRLELNTGEASLIVIVQDGAFVLDFPEGEAE